MGWAKNVLDNEKRIEELKEWIWAYENNDADYFMQKGNAELLEKLSDKDLHDKKEELYKLENQ